MAIDRNIRDRMEANDRQLSQRQPARVLLAVLVASLGALVPLVLAGGLTWLNATHTAGDVTAAVVGQFSVYVFLFAWPVSFLVTAALGVPGYYKLARRNRSAASAFRSMLLIGAVTGGVLMALIWYTMWGFAGHIPLMSLLGVTMGLISSTLFWALVR